VGPAILGTEAPGRLGNWPPDGQRFRACRRRGLHVQSGNVATINVPPRGPVMRLYNPNAKHEDPTAPGRKGTRLDLTVAEATILLNDPVWCVEIPGKRYCIGVKGGKIYVFKDDNALGYHAYPLTGKEVCSDYPSAQKWVADKLNTTVKRLSRMEQVG
jgi:hypothetical protein